MRSLIAYTDGACSGNPGPGGWGVVLQAKSETKVTKQRELKGGAQETTNNRMELMAAISALEALTRRSIITVVTDSVYVKDGVTKWIFGWKKNGWKTTHFMPSDTPEVQLRESFDVRISFCLRGFSTTTPSTIPCY